MAKNKIKLTPAGILFLIAIGVLLIALVAVIVVLSSTCGGDRDATRSNPTPTISFDPTPDDQAVPSADPSSDPEDTDPTPGPIDTDRAPDLQPIDTGSPEDTSAIIITTPNTTPTTSPSSTAKIYTSPTSAQKKKAKSGYVSKDDVNMRKGPATTYPIVKKDISKNSSVTLYELQGDWWFLKCGNNYGYIRKDMIKEGKPSTSTPKPKTTAKAPTGTYQGKIVTHTTAALRKDPDKTSKCLKEFANGEKVTVYYRTKGSDGEYWYYVSDGKSKGYVINYLVSTSGKVPTK